MRARVLCLDFLGLNPSDERIAREPGIDPDDARVVASQPREGIVGRRPEATLSGEVERDEVYVAAGHEGHPEALRKEGEKADAGV